jgi:hypothetical protein
MNERASELFAQAQLGRELNWSPNQRLILATFITAIVAECSEMVRGVLREEGSTLPYKDAATLQERFKEAFAIEPDWSEP